MAHLTRFTATLTVVIMSMTDRLRLAAKGDRGEGPVSTAIVVALLAGAAILVATAILAVAKDWIGKLNSEAGTPVL